MAVNRSPVTENPGVLQITRVGGEYLLFTLSVGGPIAIFSFASSVKGTLLEAPDVIGHPKKKYQWQHLKNPSDLQAFEIIRLDMVFITSRTYRYKVEKCAADGTVVATIMEVAFTGDPTDHTAESFVLMVS